MLPSPPYITLTEDNLRLIPDHGFLKIKRSDMIFHYPDGTQSEPFTVDRMVRGTDDAVGVLAWFKKDQKPHIYLRSCIRPALALRDYRTTGTKEAKDIGNLWELPAGGVEREELGQEGLLHAAARELHEEVGFEVPATKLKFLGKRTFLDVGSSGTRMFLCHCEVDPATRISPVGDGSPMERFAEIISVSLEDAMQAVKEGYIIDSYTEIGIRRLTDLLSV